MTQQDPVQLLSEAIRNLEDALAWLDEAELGLGAAPHIDLGRSLLERERDRLVSARN